MTEWIPQRGVYLYRQRLGLGFVLFFAGLALVGLEPHAWEWLLAAAGLTLCGVGAFILARRFL